MKALLVVDIQSGLTKRKLYNDLIFIDTVNYAIKKYRDSKHLIIYIQHNNNQLKSGAKDWEIDSRIDKINTGIVLQKHHGNSFEKTGLKTILDNNQIKEILVCGLVTNGCVRATCIGGINQGLETSLLADGHTSWSKGTKEKIAIIESELRQIGVRTVNKNEI